jgi:hypothetical protein
MSYTTDCCVPVDKRDCQATPNTAAARGATASATEGTFSWPLLGTVVPTERLNAAVYRLDTARADDSVYGWNRGEERFDDILAGEQQPAHRRIGSSTTTLMTAIGLVPAPIAGSPRRTHRSPGP